MSVAPVEAVPEQKSEGRGWISPFVVLVACQILVFASYGSTLPFLPLFLRGMVETDTEAIAWTGFIQMGMGVGLMVVTPLWGAVADRIGRKAMLLRGIVGGGVTVALLAIAMQPWHVLILRISVGAMGGVSSTAAALASTILPKRRLAMGMGLLNTFQFIGTSLGPLLGGIGAAYVGYRGVFLVTGLFMGILGIAAALLIREPAQSAKGNGAKGGPWKDIGLVMSAPRLRLPIAGLFLSQTAYIVSLTLLALQIQQLGNNDTGINATIGLVLTVNAVGMALGATVFGWLADRLGSTASVVGSFVLSAVCALVQVTLTDPNHFIIIRAVAGFAAGGVLPVLQGYLATAAAQDDSTRNSLGVVYGMVQSATSIAAVVGAALSASIGATWGISWTHLLGAILFAVAAIAFQVFGRQPRKTDPAAA